MEEIKNFQQEPDETLYQACERFKELLMKCPQHYLTEMQEHNGTSKGRSTETSDGLAAIQAQLNNLGREIKKVNENVYAAQASRVQRAWIAAPAKRHKENSNLIKKCQAMTCCHNDQDHRIKNLEIQIGQMSKSIGLILNLKKKGNYGPKFTEAYGASHINDTIPRKEKDPGSFTLPCFINNTCFDNALVDLGASGIKLTHGQLRYAVNVPSNVMSKEFHNSIMKDKMVYEGDNVVGALMNVLVFVGTFSVMTDFAILEDIDALVGGRKVKGEQYFRRERQSIPLKQINTTYPFPLDTAYRSSGTETKILCMTRSSMNELFTPYKEPEREFRSSRRHFKTLSLDELRSPDFNLLSDQEYSEEEEEEAMAETMEQFMSKTRTDYGSRVARPKIDNKDQFELKGQFLKELRENTFSGSDNENANEYIEKVLEIVDLFHVPNIIVDQLML
ncbi:hypothetical protein Tco_0409457 [Tanacetum coccineum]